jgi:hypothetical protein
MQLVSKSLLRCIARFLFHLALACLLPAFAWAQGGPPLLTDDPGTPGNGNWEFNIGFTQDVTPDLHTFAMPVFDLNYGLGPRLQLNYQVPYALVGDQGQPLQRGWGNSQAAVKWRFFQGKDWNFSTYPRLEFDGPAGSLRRGVADPGPNFLLPFEITRKVGPVDVNFEAGYRFSQGDDEDILGLAFGHQATKKLEVLGEVYHSGDIHGGGSDDTFDGGGRYEFHRGLLFLFMAGRSFLGPSSGQSQFIGYFGLQIQIERRRQSDPLPSSALIH